MQLRWQLLLLAAKKDGDEIVKKHQWILLSIFLSVIVIGSIVGVFVIHVVVFSPDWYSNGVEQNFISEESVWSDSDGMYTICFSAERLCGLLFCKNADKPLCLYFYTGRMGAPEFCLLPPNVSIEDPQNVADVLARGVWRYDENEDTITLEIDNIYDSSYGDVMKGTVIGELGLDTVLFSRVVQ